MSRPTRRLLAGLSAFLVMTSTGHAVPVPVPPTTKVQAPAWSAGSEWRYSDGYALKIASVSSQGTVFERLDAPGQWFSRLGFIRKDATSGTVTRNSIYRTIPNDAGMSLSAAAPLTFQREYMANGKLMVHASSWTVEGRETITVPAGTFDCWLIVWRTRSLRSDWTGFERWWYSPQAQNYVRLEYKYGAEPSGSRVLMQYHLGAGEPASPKALEPVAQQQLPAQPQLPPQPPLPQPQAPQPQVPQPESPQQQQPLQLRAKPAPMALPAKFSAREAGMVGAWHAQVGSAQDASAIKKSLQKILRNNKEFEALPNGVSAHNVDSQGTFYRAWIGSYEMSADARALCRQLKLGKPGCTVFKSATLEAKAGP